NRRCCPPGNCPIMLFAPTLADRAILPTAWRGRYFFNRIGQKQTLNLGVLSAGSVEEFGPAKMPTY
ncbi:hypothetical protein, partial [Pseudomonas aeruginosa]|uniref:hypothetical protein n=1 Tax=Pseudomonas aeruginosa TaxID=287 RepID=UPI0021E1D992